MIQPTHLPANLGTIDWTNWVRGLAAAFIGGGAGAVQVGFSTVVVDPQDFNVHAGKLYVVMLVSFLFSGTMSMMAFLHQQPIPALIAKSESTRTEPDGTITVKTKEVTVPTQPVSDKKGE